MGNDISVYSVRNENRVKTTLYSWFASIQQRYSAHTRVHAIKQNSATIKSTKLPLPESTTIRPV